MSITLTAFLEQLEAICATKPDYRIGGSGTDGTCDCIGLIIGAVRRAGGSWKGYHGSNYAARKQMADFVELKPAHLFVGEIVFKARNPGDSSYSLPDRYKSGGANCIGDLRDYYHVGVITRVRPLETTHCSTTVNGNSIHRDATLGKWKYGGRLKGIDYGTTQEETDMSEVKMQETRNKATVTGGRLSLRQAPSKTADRLAWIPNGTRLDVIGQGDGWCAVTYDTIPGYVMERYLILDGETEEKPKTDTERLEALENQAAEFEQRIAALEGGAG